MRHEFPTVNFRRVFINLRRIWEIMEQQKLPKLLLSEAVLLAGYSGVVNGTARSFLSAAEQYGLITQDPVAWTMEFTPLAKEVFKQPLDPVVLKSAALSPPFFQKLFSYFNNNLHTFSTEIHSALKMYEGELSPNQRGIAAESFSKTLMYLRDLLPSDPTIRASSHSRDGRVSIHFPPDMDRRELIIEATRVLNEIKQ